MSGPAAIRAAVDDVTPQLLAELEAAHATIEQLLLHVPLSTQVQLVNAGGAPEQGINSVTGYTRRLAVIDTARRALAAAALAACALLQACGGGDPEPEPNTPTPVVDCKLHPEQCR